MPIYHPGTQWVAYSPCTALPGPCGRCTRPGTTHDMYHTAAHGALMYTARCVIPAVLAGVPKELLPFYGFSFYARPSSFILLFPESASTMLWSSYTESSFQLRDILLRNNIPNREIVTARDLARLKTLSELRIILKPRGKESQECDS